jgi:hypothetical protein
MANNVTKLSLKFIKADPKIILVYATRIKTGILKQAAKGVIVKY